MDKQLLSGNEAVALGAWRAGVRLGVGYPGTPSSEILPALAKYDGPHVQWSINEKVSLEVAAGAAMSGGRSLVTMKHVGLNVAADPLLTLSYIGVEGGLVLAVADDPGMASSQNEQDTRNYVRFAKVPCLEPSDSQEAADLAEAAFEISERFDTPVILRLTTAICHSRGGVGGVESLELRVESGEGRRRAEFKKRPAKYVMIPAYARKRRVEMETRTAELAKFSDECELNRIEPGDDGGKLGVISQGVAYQYAKEAFPDATFLKMGLSWPLPEAKIRELAGKVERLLIVEELDALVELDVRAMGLEIEIHGRDVLSGIGPLSVDALLAAKAKLAGQNTAPPAKAEAGLPGRPPALCPGCSHRGVFYTLHQLKMNVMGDIGCYSLAVLPPLEGLDSIICMGAGFGAAQGMSHLGLGKNTVGVMGDSTFFHSGLTGLADVVYNQAPVTLLVLDNHTTAMTGHQPHPGTGKTLRGIDTHEMNIAEIARAMGVRRVYEMDAYDMTALKARITEEVEADEPSLIVVKGPCSLQVGSHRTAEKRTIDPEKCTGCKLCLNLGCPAIVLKETDGKQHAAIDKTLCAGCGLCVQVCPFGAIG